MVLSSSSMNAADAAPLGAATGAATAPGPVTRARSTHCPKLTSSPSVICAQSSARSLLRYTPERLPPSRTQRAAPSQ